MPREVLADFPTTHATFLTVCLDTATAESLSEARNHLMARYRAPLVAYAAQSRLATVDEPDELVHGFFAAKVADARYLADWRASGIPLRRWMLNGLVFHARGILRDRARENARSDGAEPENLVSNTPDAEHAFERAWAFALVEAACRAAYATLDIDGRTRAYDCFHRHFFDGVSYAQLAVECGLSESAVAGEVRLAMRRVRAEAESMLRDEIGTADGRAIAAELMRVRELTGWSV
jgi:DNA-directed RNA polymerase specialized sigma24 family protein